MRNPLPSSACCFGVKLFRREALSCFRTETGTRTHTAHGTGKCAAGTGDQRHSTKADASWRANQV
eukprot:1229228-Prymnesium_polylepis.1